VIRSERRRLVLLLAVFLTVNFLTLSRYPSVWVDEIQFADPAVSLASGQGFTSTAWFAQDSSAFFAGNVPLYPFLLSLWLRVFGVSLIAERSLNLGLFTLALLLLWRWMHRSAVVPSPTWRLAAIALFCCGHAMVFSYRSGRYDVTGMLLVALILNTLERPWLVAALAALLPAAGLQLIPATIIASGLALVVWRRSAVRPVLALAAGVGTGAVGLFLFYLRFGVWESFRASTSAIGTHSQTFLSKLGGLPSAYLTDKSRIAAAAAFAILAAVSWRGLTLPSRRLVAFATAVLLLLPAALQMAAKFPIYYGWMVFLPLILAVAHLASANIVWRFPVAVLLTIAGLAGLPLRLAGVLASFDERSPDRVTHFVRGVVSEEALVLADFRTYYALLNAGLRPLLPTYVPAMTPTERRAVRLLILRDVDLEPARQALGGTWQATGAQLPPPREPSLFRKAIAELREEDYSLTVYRRTGTE
jgi:hypothetical protein